MSEGPTFPSAEATHSVKKDGGFAKFVQNRAVQMAGVGLLGIFIGTGATATGVAVAGNGNGPDRSGFSQQWQAPGGNGMPALPGDRNGTQGGSQQGSGGTQGNGGAQGNGGTQGGFGAQAE